ncbi:unnamed protein product [Paramecium sonneborni]|uniref:Uncharacterized protein n=1 Tax=Paramecium sonneborni TaxID=65129 RepID=A0A8S1PF00_9CILI|nr:unnamed protein product [Paramecium sonneborni]
MRLQKGISSIVNFFQIFFRDCNLAMQFEQFKQILTMMIKLLIQVKQYWLTMEFVVQ